jgi:hypothetical protein
MWILKVRIVIETKNIKKNKAYKGMQQSACTVHIKHSNQSRIKSRPLTHCNITTVPVLPTWLSIN